MFLRIPSAHSLYAKRFLLAVVHDLETISDPLLVVPVKSKNYWDKRCLDICELVFAVKFGIGSNANDTTINKKTS